MDPQKYADSRLQRQRQLKNDVPNAASDIRVVSTPLTLVRPAQEYLKQQRTQTSSESSGSDTQVATKEHTLG